MKRAKNKISLTLDETTMPIIEQLTDGMPGGFFIYRAEGEEELLYFNTSILRIYGCETREEFIELTDNTFRGMVHPEDLDKVEKSIRDQVEKSIYDLDYVEYRITRKDGSIRWVEDYGHFLYTEKYGNIFYVFIEDATERLRDRIQELESINTELKRLHAREVQYKKALLKDSISFCEINLTRDEFLKVSSHIHNGEEYDLTKKVGDQPLQKYSQYVKQWEKNISEDRLETYRTFFRVDRLKRCYKEGKLEQSYECQIIDAMGRPRLWQFVLLLGKNENSDDIIALVIIKDITEQLTKQNLLLAALQQAQVAKIARNTFLSNMSHDIRTPLNAIIGYTDLARDHKEEVGKVENYMDKIQMSSEQLLAILNESLEVTRIESGKVSLIERECHLADLLEDIESTFRLGIQEKGVRFYVDKDEVRHFSVVIDYIRLKEILCQLVDNAMKYTEPGGAVCLILKESDIAVRGYAKFQFMVKDDGIGISEEFQTSLFEPFKRENNTTESGIPGTGLGLTVVKGLVDIMGGEISVKSKLGEGCCFTVSMLVKLQKKQQEEHSGDVEKDSIELVSLKGKRILVVEDNEINREIVEEVLKSEGFLVETAQNGEEALEKIQESTAGYYSLVLMDIQMPVMDGYEATKAIRNLKDKKLAAVPIVALSANAFAEDYQHSLDVGMDAHVPKPIDRIKLREVLRQLIRKESNEL
ncbi:MAG: response regulator [Eubacterium sp.]|nr:response regulator [Eubacterium sp.]